METTTHSGAALAPHEDEYRPLLDAIARTFTARTLDAHALFTVDTLDLWEAYLRAVPDRRVHDCRTCRQFITRFGGLVTIGADGALTSVLWDPATFPASYEPVANVLRRLVEHRPVARAFRSADAMLGAAHTPHPAKGDFYHPAVALPAALRHRDRLSTPDQWAAQIAHRHETVGRALGEFSPALLDQALRVLEADAVTRAEKFVGPVQFLRDLHATREAARGRAHRDHLLWRAVATAPEGFCHPRASVVGTLLEDIAAGLPFDEVQRRWTEKLHPLRYQRPQAAPSAQTIQRAEAIFATLGLAPALERRFARLAECETIWTPRAADAREATAPVGVFGDLTPKGARAHAVPPVDLPAQTVTWEKFVRTVLADALAIDFWVPTGAAPFIALVTATHADAPPILKWDRPEANDGRRNPVSHYLYHGGSYAARWQLPAGAYRAVTGIVPRPNLWGRTHMPELGAGVVLVLDGARDTQVRELALFPETLRGELHEVRSVIEAHSKRRSITGEAEASACGYYLGKEGLAAAVQLRVRTARGTQTYRINRWD